MNLDYRHADEIITANGNVLWLGDFQAADDRDWLNSNNIRTVITVGDRFNLNYQSTIRHYKYAIDDTKQQNISQYFDDSVNKISKGLKSGSVLVHCGAGVSRSSTIVIAYLMTNKMMTFHQALKYVRNKRSVICPNLGFERQLKVYQKQIFKWNTDNLNNNSVQISKHQKQISAVNMNGTILNFKINQKAPVKASTPFLKSNPKKQMQRMTLMKQWKLYPRAKNSQQFPALLISKSLTNSYAPRSQKKTQIENRNKELKKIAQFRFGVTNTEKWKIF